MGWDLYTYPLRCEGCGRTGSEVQKENDWGQSNTSFEGFSFTLIKSPRQSRQLEPATKVPVCPDCGDGVTVRRV